MDAYAPARFGPCTCARRPGGSPRAHRTILRAAVLCALSVVTAAPAASAFCRTTTVRPRVVGDCSAAGAPLYWRGMCASYSLSISGSPDPDFIPVDLLPDGGPGVRDALETSAGRWHQAGCDMDGVTQPYFEVHALGDTATPTGIARTGPNANTISFNTEWRADVLHDPQAIAITIVTFDIISGEILDADMEINARYNQFALDGRDPDRIDLPTVLTHEFGHFQGLAHNQDNPSTVMFPVVMPGQSRRTLTTDDSLGICAIYPPESPPDRICNLTPNGGFAVTPTGGRVSGGCAAGHRESGTSVSAWLSGAALLALASLARRRR